MTTMSLDMISDFTLVSGFGSAGAQQVNTLVK